MRVNVYPGLGEVRASKVEQAVRDLCQSRKTANDLDGRRVPLTADIVDKLVHRMVDAASHAASGAIENRVRGRGAPPDNARIILADDVLKACGELGISQGLRYAPPESFAVDLFSTIAAIIFPGGANARKTFDRLRRHPITGN